MEEPTVLIESRAGVRSGKPVFVGTRLTVEDIVEYLVGGMTSDEVLHDFPELTLQHIDAASAHGQPLPRENYADGSTRRIR